MKEMWRENTYFNTWRGRLFARSVINRIFCLLEYSYGSLAKSNYKCPWDVSIRTLACCGRNKCHLWLIKWCDLFLACFPLSSISITFILVSAFQRLGTGSFLWAALSFYKLTSFIFILLLFFFFFGVRNF